MCRYYKKSYAYSARSERPAHGPIHFLNPLASDVSIGTFPMLRGYKSRNLIYCPLQSKTFIFGKGVVVNSGNCCPGPGLVAVFAYLPCLIFFLNYSDGLCFGCC